MQKARDGAFIGSKNKCDPLKKNLPWGVVSLLAPGVFVVGLACQLPRSETSAFGMGNDSPLPNDLTNLGSPFVGGVICTRDSGEEFFRSMPFCKGCPVREPGIPFRMGGAIDVSGGKPSKGSLFDRVRTARRKVPEGSSPVAAAHRAAAATPKGRVVARIDARIDGPTRMNENNVRITAK